MSNLNFLSRSLSFHPRLLLRNYGREIAHENTTNDTHAQQLHNRLTGEAEQALTMPPLAFTLTGKRLLDVSRDAMHRIPTLALAFRTTGDRRFCEGARETMQRISTFKDFNPSHFLDVAEMIAALGIGYDWLFEELSPPERVAIRSMIVRNGFTPSFTSPEPDWVNGDTNWNQVCNGGLLLGALAIAEDEPELSARVIKRAIAGLPHAMRHYAPDGGYPEGPMYWIYGTTYNLLAIAALQSALGDDFGLSRQPGFARSADYHLHLIGPTGQCFSYCDCRETANDDPCAAAYYLAGMRSDASLLFHERTALDRLLTTPVGRGDNHSDTWLLLAWSDLPGPITVPAVKHYVAAGETPVATFRSGWDADATFVGIKGGSPSVNHGHMDVGTFCLDALGVRWAGSLGMQDYHSLESRGVNLWDMAADSQRWRVFRIGPMTHNILIVNGRDQIIAGHASIVKSSDSFAILDTGPVYAGQLASAMRGIRLRPDRSVRLQDEVTALPRSSMFPPADPTVIRWTILTRADVVVDGATAILRKDGKQLTMQVVLPAAAMIMVTPADPPNAYDAPNPGAWLVTFEVVVPHETAMRVVVDFLPGDVCKGGMSPVVALAAW